jgi:hypothetical protein
VKGVVRMINLKINKKITLIRRETSILEFRNNIFTYQPGDGTRYFFDVSETKSLYKINGFNTFIYPKEVRKNELDPRLYPKAETILKLHKRYKCNLYTAWAVYDCLSMLTLMGGVQ